MGVIKSGRRLIDTSNEDRILFPKSKITKGDVISYFQKISKHMLSFMKNHPLTMERYPYGIQEEGFYHKDAPDYFPSWIKTMKMKKKDGGFTHYVVCNDEATLIYLANQGCLTQHLWLSRVDKIDYPDKMIIDLDPGKSSFEKVQSTAFLIKEILEELDLTSFVMLTGSSGVHIVVPLSRKQTYEEVRNFAYDIALWLLKKDPQNTTLEIRKNKRGKKIFIDTLRNQLTATAVAPYSIRAYEGAPVATPIDWKEMSDPKLISQRYTIKTVFNRLKKKGDPWKLFLKKSYSLFSAHKKLKKMLT